MKYISTRSEKEAVSFRQAILSGMAKDGGLYMPERIPSYSKETLLSFAHKPFHELAQFILQPYLDGEVSAEVCRSVCEDAFSFPLPLIPIHSGMYVLELFHGPTLAFKDFGARFLARIMGYFTRTESQPALVLVATSGDTGSAVAQGFHRVPGIRVVVFYPGGKVSPLQEKQFATLGDNIQALKVKGSFDDCQSLVKSCLQDPRLREKYLVTTANSINIGRLLPQMVYYLYAWMNLPDPDKGIVVSVPSGNFGNLTAGLLARFSGMPVEKFIASTNANRVVPDYLETAEYRPRPSVKTLANAMDVGNPNNVERMMALFDRDHKAITEVIYGTSMNTDQDIRQAIKDLFQQTGYITDPHGAIAWGGLRPWLELNPNLQGFFLGTAHPAKFYEDVSGVVPGLKMPDSLVQIMDREVLGIPVDPDVNEAVGKILEAD